MPPPSANLPSESQVRNTALERLRTGSNPFASQVMSVGTAEESLQVSVSEFAANQLSDLLYIIGTYREGRPETRVYPLLGDRGSGKTHLAYVLLAELRRKATEAGEETMVVVVDRLSTGMDSIDYLLWQIVNHLLASKGDGERMLGVIAGRLTGRLLSEALRQLAPPQRVELIPPRGWWDRWRLRMGSASRVRTRQERIEQVIQTCESKNPPPEQIRQACQEAFLPLGRAVKVIEEYLERTESKDVLGWFRKELYVRLAKFALLEDREPFEELHGGEYEKAPSHVAKAGSLSHRLLDTWLSLLTALSIPVLVLFDQLEDYLRSADSEQENINRRFFTNAMALFINELKHVCILIFAEQSFWFDLLNRAEAYAAERLSQPFPLPGRPAKPYIQMPETVPSAVLPQLIQERVRYTFPDLNWTGLPPIFPFKKADLEPTQKEPSIRLCLRKLAKRYDEIVYETPRPPDKLLLTLTKLWKEHIEVAGKRYGTEMVFPVAFIPEVQNALQGWLECLEQNQITGSSPWRKVEILTEPMKQPYGNLIVIRYDKSHLPGIGIAAWLGKKSAQPFDLRQRIGFFNLNPRPIRTLVLLRADGEDALVGQTRGIYEDAIEAKRDIRIQSYEAEDLHGLMAFAGWRQAALVEVEEEKENNPEAEAIFRQFLADRSRKLLDWIDSWRQPVAAPNSKERSQ